MLVGQRVALEAGSQQDVLVVHRQQAERPRRPHVQLLEGLETLGQVVPQVHSGEGIVAPQNQVLTRADAEGEHRHGPAGRESLDLHKLLPFPAEDLGVSDKTREADVENFPHPEVFDHLYVSQIRDLGPEDKLFLAPVPLVNRRWLGGAGEDEVRLPAHLQELHVDVAIPRVEGLVGVEAIAVPAINAGGTGLGAVGHHKVPFFIQLEGVHKVGLPDAGRVDVLDLHEPLRGLLPPGTTEGFTCPALSEIHS